MHEAIRCAECHNKMHSEWKTSAHSRAESSSEYHAMRKAASDTGCGDRCHAPLRVYTPEASAVLEGATCDVCHTIKGVETTDSNAVLTLGLDDMIRYGPLCDAKNHYFHRMGCSELHTRSELCSGCHHFYWPSKSGKNLPVLTTWEEWQAQGKADQSCQSCHMPGTRAEVATGAGERDKVPDHSFMGHKGKLRKQALAVEVRATKTADNIAVSTKLTNVGSAHSIPSGIPARRIAIVVTLAGARGAEHTETRSLGRFMVDDAGKPAAFVVAAKVDRDTRIAAGKSAVEQVELPIAAGTISVKVEWRSLDPLIADSLGTDSRTEVLAAVTIPTAKLPKTVRAGAKAK